MTATVPGRGVVVSDLGADYREAKAAVVDHLVSWADAESALHLWLRSKRGVPRHKLYDAETGDPLDPELKALEDAVDTAEAGYQWCRGLVVACGEKVKGRTFDEVVASQGSRPSVDELLAKVED